MIGVYNENYTAQSCFFFVMEGGGQKERLMRCVVKNKQRKIA